METIFIPVGSSPVIPGSSYFDLIPGCAIDDSAVPVPREKFEPALKSFAATGRVQCNREWGTVVARRFGLFEVCLPNNAQKLVEASAIRFLALKIAGGRVAEAWMADRPVSEITHLERVQKMQRSSGGSTTSTTSTTTLTKSAHTAPQEKESTMDLESAVRKALASPQSVREGFVRKDIATPARTPSRTQTAPRGTIDVSELAHANDEIRVIGEHLREAQRANPGSRQIADAGMSWYAVSSLGLGIDDRYFGGTQTVPVSPNSEALAEAWAHSTGDKAAGGFLNFRKALTKTRQAPNVMSRDRGEISSRPFFSKSDSESVDGGSEAGQILRRHSMETALARLKVLKDKITAAIASAGSDSMAQPHLSSAHRAAGKATAHIQSCLESEN